MTEQDTIKLLERVQAELNELFMWAEIGDGNGNRNYAGPNEELMDDVRAALVVMRAQVRKQAHDRAQLALPL